MPVDVDDINLVAARTVEVYREAELHLLAVIKNALDIGMDAPTWAADRLANITKLRTAAARVLRRANDGGPRIRNGIARAYRNGWGGAVVDLPRSYGGDTARDAAEALKRTEVIDSLANALIRDVGAREQNVLRHVDDIYRGVIAGAVARSVGAGITRREASQSAWQAFTDQGVSSFVDESGRVWRLTSYVEMAVRTVTMRAAVQGQVDRLLSEGEDLVVVSDHAGECSLCLIPGTVVEGPVPTGRTRSEYTGNVVRILTASGKDLTGTPDHPVLTPRGWVPLKDLAVGDQVVSQTRQHGVASVVPGNVQVPSRIEEAGKAWLPVLLSGPTRRDFDDDVTYRQVRYVPANVDLPTKFDSPFSEPVADCLLVGGIGATASFLRGGDVVPMELSQRHATGRGVRGIQHLSTFLRGGVLPSLQHSLGRERGSLLMAERGHVLDDAVMTWPGLNSSPSQIVSDCPTADAEGGSELLRALAGKVTLDEVVSLSVSQFSGHVWDLSTEPAWYVANGIVTHNCRPWEGKILRIGSGPIGEVTDEDVTTGEPITFEVAGTLAGAMAAGLLHPNCEHTIRSFIPGATRLPANTEDAAGDQAKQRQRYIERQIRRFKEREVAALTPAAKLAATRKVRAWQQEMRDHLAANPTLRRLPYREQIGAGNLPPGGHATPPAGRLTGPPSPPKDNGPDPAPEPEPDLEPDPTPDDRPDPAPEPVSPPRQGDEPLRNFPALKAAGARYSTRTGRLTLRRTTQWTDGAVAERARALGDYFREDGTGTYRDMNGLLRGNGVPADRRPLVASKISRVDEVMEASPLAADVELYRSLSNAALVFGDRFDQDLTGFEWTDPAFSSATPRKTQSAIFAAKYSPGGGAGARIRFVARKGTGAVHIDSREVEILLQRGLTFRITADHGLVLNPHNGRKFRELDAEIVEPRRPEAKKDRREAARARHREISRREGVADALTGLDELLGKNATVKVFREHVRTYNLADEDRDDLLAAVDDALALRRLIDTIGDREGLTPIGSAGDHVAFDPEQHDVYGDQLPTPGTRMQVAARGTVLTLPDGTVIQLHKAMVVTPTGRARANEPNPELDAEDAGQVGRPDIREVLREADSATAVGVALAREIRALTGRDVPVDFGPDADADTAREHAEGVLRVLDRYPHLALQSVTSMDPIPGSARYAEAQDGEIRFSTGWSTTGQRARYLEQVRRDTDAGWHPAGATSPMANAIHEMGHVAHDMAGRWVNQRVTALLQEMATREGLSVDELIGRHVSRYAQRDLDELVAEALSDVLTRGSDASELSRGIVAILDDEVTRGGSRGPRPPRPSEPELTPEAARYHLTVDGIADLAELVERGQIVHDRPLTGGSVADTHLVEFADGRRLVRKRSRTLNEGRATMQADAEQLVSVLARALGISAPRVYRNDQMTVWLEYVDAPNVGSLYAATRSADDAEELRDRLAIALDTDESRRLGLLDLMIRNSDRHSENWLLTAENEPVPIDHGYGFGPALGLKDGPWAPLARDEGLFDSSHNGPFAAHFAEDFDHRLAVWHEHDLTAEDMDDARRRLEELVDAFGLVGRPEWLAYALRVLDALAPFATGARNLIAGR